ncbi:uncharacterized protein TOT_040000811 [Theileria orientalis strain Shintoku]|uniref:SfiI-subtelomeric related protein family member n=1 Tax=Theileria orientalis strain Shintoku TaxID=869250 RepID=J7MF54_THEOR|nr:uncharacterized protein TOT_040000811 [Theileria orientalis strain Shintoku]BAM42444.1 uncharacterized protein TOT_040000811 [Theileria orientalis strain Shintoku]|eukprot:XP_009692745.1 uncharacterized protein TOT_040000811 [Theileria orientalis strain Shintoku]
MNLPFKFIFIIFYFLSRNKQNIVVCVGNTYPGGQNEITDLILQSEPRGLEIVTEGSTGPNDATKYNFRRVGENETHYIFKKGVKCTEVRAQGSTVWKVKKGGFYPGAVSFYEPDEIAINFSNDLIVLYYRRSKWRFREELLESEIESLKQPPNLNNTGIVLNIGSIINGDLFNFIREENLDSFTPKEGHFFKILRQNRSMIWSTTNPNQYANAIHILYKKSAFISQVNRRWKIIEFKPEPEYLELENNLITLDIKQKKTTDCIKFGVYPGFIKFIATNINIFNKIIDGCNTIWEPKNGKYSKTVTVKTTGKGIKTVRVFNIDDEIEDIEIKFQLVDVDISRTESTAEIDYQDNGFSKIYEPKDGFFFKSINEKGDVIWRSEELCDHGHKVEVREVNGIRKAYIYVYEAGVIKKYQNEGVAPGAGSYSPSPASLMGPYRKNLSTNEDLCII